MLPNMKQYLNAPDSLVSACMDVINEYDGNVIEIGGGEGFNTLRLSAVARSKNKKYILIDPFEDNWANIPETFSKPYPYNSWRERTKNCDNIVHIRKPSQDASVLKELEPYMPFCFAFVDGLQFKDSVLTDLITMDKALVKCICVDDFTRLKNTSQVPLAVEEFLKVNPDYTIIKETVSVRAKAFLHR